MSNQEELLSDSSSDNDPETSEDEPDDVSTESHIRGKRRSGLRRWVISVIYCNSKGGSVKLHLMCSNIEIKLRFGFVLWYGKNISLGQTVYAKTVKIIFFISHVDLKGVCPAADFNVWNIVEKPTPLVQSMIILN